MRKSSIFLVFTLFAALMPVIVWAQDIAKETGNGEFLFFLLKSLGGLSGASGLAASAIVVQIAMKALNTPYFAKYFANGDANRYKIPVLYGLNFIGGLITLKGQGLDLPTILMHSTTSASFQQAFFNTVKQFKDKR